MTLSPSQSAVLYAIKKNPIRWLPRGAVIDTKYADEGLVGTLTVLGCRWEWSRTIDLEANTSDYRRRIWEINQMHGYKIISFHAPYKMLTGGMLEKHITRHAYLLVTEPAKESEAT